MATQNTTEIRITGNTKPRAEILGKLGYRWNATSKYWSRAVEMTPEIAEYSDANRDARRAAGIRCWDDVTVLVVPQGCAARVYYRGPNAPAISGHSAPQPLYGATIRGSNPYDRDYE